MFCNSKHLDYLHFGRTSPSTRCSIFDLVCSQPCQQILTAFIAVAISNISHLKSLHLPLLSISVVLSLLLPIMNLAAGIWLYFDGDSHNTVTLDAAWSLSIFDAVLITLASVQLSGQPTRRVHVLLKMVRLSVSTSLDGRAVSQRRSRVGREVLDSGLSPLSFPSNMRSPCEDMLIIGRSSF